MAWTKSFRIDGQRQITAGCGETRPLRVLEKARIGEIQLITVISPLATVSGKTITHQTSNQRPLRQAIQNLVITQWDPKHAGYDH